MHFYQIFKSTFALDLHLRSATPDVNEQPLVIPSVSESAELVRVPAGDGPHRRIIKPSKNLVARSQALRAAAEVAAGSNIKVAGIGSLGCPCWPASPKSNSGPAPASSLAQVEVVESTAGSTLPDKNLSCYSADTTIIPAKDADLSGRAEIAFDNIKSANGSSVVLQSCASARGSSV